MSHIRSNCVYLVLEVGKPGVILGGWTELPVYHQIVLNAKLFLEWGNVLSLASLTLLISARLRWQMGWHFSHRQNLLPQARLCVPALPGGRTTYLASALALEPGEKRKRWQFWASHQNFLKLQYRTWAPPWRTDLPGLKSSCSELSLRNPLCDWEDTYLTLWVFTLCIARHSVIHSMSKRTGTQDSWALLFTSWPWATIKAVFAHPQKTGHCHSDSRPQKEDWAVLFTEHPCLLLVQKCWLTCQLL